MRAAKFILQHAFWDFSSRGADWGNRVSDVAARVHSSDIWATWNELVFLNACPIKKIYLFLYRKIKN